MDEQKEKVAPTSALGKAIAYARGHLHKARRYTEHILLTPDNNPIERVIRPFVTGRKNWLFALTPLGAHASAGLYSLVMTAKANGLDPFEYLTMLFSELPKVAPGDTDGIAKLLPYAWAAEKNITPGSYFPAPDQPSGKGI